MLSAEQLELQPTLEIVAEMQRSLAKGSTVAEALRDARAAHARAGHPPAGRVFLRVLGRGRLAPFQGR